MIRVLITGATGFAGRNLCSYLDPTDFEVQKLNLREPLNPIQNADAVIHLAGKAHDLKNTSSPEEFSLVNTKLTKQLFDAFLQSTATCFVFVSSVKAVRDSIETVLTEDTDPEPQTPYGISKRAAEQYILNSRLPADKRVFILRPCMMHGRGNRGNLNLLYKLIATNLPWPLGAFENNRSFLSIENFCFAVSELIKKKDIPGGIYNVADSNSISTNKLIKVIAEELHSSSLILNLPKKLMSRFARLGDRLKLPFNTERLNKLTEDYVVSNAKLIAALGKPLPVNVVDGIRYTIRSFRERQGK